MEGVLVNYRMARHHQRCNQMVLKVEGIDKKEKATALLGKTVIWASPAGKEIKGKIAKEHGNSGALKVTFETGMPGQSIGTKVKIE